MNERYCVHSLMWLDEKIESTAIRERPLINPYPSSQNKWWRYGQMTIDGHEVLYSYRMHQAWGSDYQIAQSLVGVFIGHDVDERNSRGFCDHISEMWKRSANFVDFMFEFSAHSESGKREEILKELCTRYTGILDLDKVSFMARHKAKGLRREPMIKTDGRFLYTLEPPKTGRSNLELFGVKTKFEGVSLI